MNSTQPYFFPQLIFPNLISTHSPSSPPVVEVLAALHQAARCEDGRVSPETEKRLRLSYKRSVKTMRDPFKRAVYCFLARCDVREDHGDIVTTTDDYLWLKLSLVSGLNYPNCPW